MGIYHQGGIIPTQSWLGHQKSLSPPLPEVLWWRTYPPPIWLLDHNPITTTDLMGIPFSDLQSRINTALDPECGSNKTIGLVAPWSSLEFDDERMWRDGGLVLEEVWRWNRHLNLDDLDVGGEGVVGTVRRVVGRRGLVLWRVGRVCGGKDGRRGVLSGDW